MTAWDKLTLAVQAINNASGGTLLPVLAVLWLFVIGSALFVLWQAQGGGRV